MMDEYSKNPRDESKEIFSKMEAKVTNISHNMSILMLALKNKFGPFREFGISNLRGILDEKSRDKEDREKESKNEPLKERPSSSSITSSQYLFKVKAKVDIKPYRGKIDDVKLFQWLK
jgi:hypothetical protein